MIDDQFDDIAEPEKLRLATVALCVLMLGALVVSIYVGHGIDRLKRMCHGSAEVRK